MCVCVTVIEWGRCNMAYEFSLLSELLHPEREETSSSHAAVQTPGKKKRRSKKRSKNECFMIRTKWL